MCGSLDLRVEKVVDSVRYPKYADVLIMMPFWRIQSI